MKITRTIESTVKLFAMWISHFGNSLISSFINALNLSLFEEFTSGLLKIGKKVCKSCFFLYSIKVICHWGYSWQYVINPDVQITRMAEIGPPVTINELIKVSECQVHYFGFLHVLSHLQKFYLFVSLSGTILFLSQHFTWHYFTTSALRASRHSCTCTLSLAYNHRNPKFYPKEKN